MLALATARVPLAVAMVERCCAKSCDEGDEARAKKGARRAYFGGVEPVRAKSMMMYGAWEAGKTGWEACVGRWGGLDVALIYSTSTHHRLWCTWILVAIPCLNGSRGGYIGGVQGQC